MDEYKLRAKEKIDAIHVAAITAAGTSKTRVEDVLQHTAEVLRKIRESFHSLWHNELIAEGRERVAAWSRDALQRIKDGAPPLSPLLLYDELLALFKDRVWRRSVLIFSLGAAAGALLGVAAGVRLAAPPPAGPHARALLANEDHVVLVDDAVTPGAGTNELLIRVQAFSVSPVDRCVLRGRGAVLRQLTNRSSVVVGRGWAGVVLDAGAGVEHLELGDEVWGVASEWGQGAASELFTTSSNRVSKRPFGVAADAAATLPWAGTEAMAAADSLAGALGDLSGKRIALAGAGCMEGICLVQLLSSSNAHVTAHAPAHTRTQIMKLGASEFIPSEGEDGLERPVSWFAALELRAKTAGPWDAVVLCPGAGAGPAAAAGLLLKARAPRSAVRDLRARRLLSDRLPAPFSLVFVATFYTYRVLRWVVGAGWDTEWLEPSHRTEKSLQQLTQIVQEGRLKPVLDKVYLPQDYETALAHACSDDAFGTIVVRFP